MKTYIKNYIYESSATKDNILSNETILDSIQSITKLILDAYKEGKKVLIAGNGGSAADAQHIATELVSKFQAERAALNAIALTTNTSILTAIANDYNFDNIFSRQIEAYGSQGDIYIAISTSGNSKNIIKSIEIAKEKGLKVIGFTGAKPCLMDNLCEILIKVPSEKTPIIQESHIMIAHIICGLVENSID